MEGACAPKPSQDILDQAFFASWTWLFVVFAFLVAFLATHKTRLHFRFAPIQIALAFHSVPPSPTAVRHTHFSRRIVQGTRQTPWHR